MKSLLLTLVAVVIGGAVQYPSTSMDETSNLAPRARMQLNPHPSQPLILQGNIDPKLLKDVRINWHIIYGATNPDKKDCERSAGFDHENTFYLHQKEEIYSIRPKAHGFYRQLFYADKYLPGYCRWRIMSMSEEIISSSGYMISSVFDGDLGFFGHLFNHRYGKIGLSYDTHTQRYRVADREYDPLPDSKNSLTHGSDQFTLDLFYKKVS